MSEVVEPAILIVGVKRMLGMVQLLLRLIPLVLSNAHISDW